jgi:hypothetical protein
MPFDRKKIHRSSAVGLLLAQKSFGNRDTVSVSSWSSFGIGMTVIIQAKGTKRPRGIREKNLYLSMSLKNKNYKEGILDR